MWQPSNQRFEETNNPHVAHKLFKLYDNVLGEKLSHSEF